MKIFNKAGSITGDKLNFRLFFFLPLFSLFLSLSCLFSSIKDLADLALAPP